MHRRPGPRKPWLSKATGMLLLAAFALLLPTVTHAQSGSWNAQEVLAAKEWVAPPSTIADAVLAPRWLNVALSDRTLQVFAVLWAAPMAVAVFG